MHLNDVAHKLNTILQVKIDTDSRSVKLTALDDYLKEASGKSNATPSNQLRRYLLSMSTKSGMKDLFEGTKDELELSRRVIKSAISYI